MRCLYMGCFGQNMTSMDCFLANLVAGKLNTEVLSNPYLMSSEVLDHINHSTLIRFVNDLKCCHLLEFTRKRH
jgi:hypothetical protein